MRDGTWSEMLVTAFFAGAGAMSANLLGNMTCRDRYGNLEWRDLALITAVGSSIGIRYVKIIGG
uniref:Uncharacterized protein n=1 Tax=viral metagenome TaxID=1070528 RepID=A0A6C0C3M1_9ZZZZ